MRKKIFKDFGEILRAYSKTLKYLLKIDFFNTLGLLVTTLLTALIPFASAILISKIIDGVVKDNPSETIYIFVAGWLGLFAMKSLIDKFHDFLNVKVIMNFGREFDNEVTRKFAYLDLEYYEDPKISTLLEKVRVAYAGAPLDFVNGSFKTLVQLIRIISATVILAFFSPLLILLIIVSMIPQLINSLVFGKNLWYIWSAKEELRKNYSAIRKYLHDYKFLPEVTVFGIKEFLLNSLKSLHHEFQLEQEKHTKNKLLVGLGLDIFKILGIGVPFVFLTVALIAKTLSLALFNLYFTSMYQLQSSTEDFFNNLANMHNSGLFVVDIFKFLELPQRVKDGTVKMDKTNDPPLIEINDIAFKYPLTSKNILYNFSLTIKPSEHVAIVGENGAGKTTLIKLLMRFYDTDTGTIALNGTDIKDLKIDSWYQNVGTLFQDFNKYHFDVKTNIGLGDISNISDIKNIDLSASKAGADEFIKKFEDKYDQVLSRVFEGGTDLSGGQWQKIAIARVFFRNPGLIILDEPTSAIDPKSEAEIFERIFEFTKDRSVIIVSPRFSTVRNASRILVMEDGRIIEDGTHKQLMDIPNGKYKSAFEIQRKGYE